METVVNDSLVNYIINIEHDSNQRLIFVWNTRLDQRKCGLKRQWYEVTHGVNGSCCSETLKNPGNTSCLRSSNTWRIHPNRKPHTPPSPRRGDQKKSNAQNPRCSVQKTSANSWLTPLFSIEFSQKKRRKHSKIVENHRKSGKIINNAGKVSKTSIFKSSVLRFWDPLGQPFRCALYSPGRRCCRRWAIVEISWGARPAGSIGCLWHWVYQHYILEMGISMSIMGM